MRNVEIINYMSKINIFIFYVFKRYVIVVFSCLENKILSYFLMDFSYILTLNGFNFFIKMHSFFFYKELKLFLFFKNDLNKYYKNLFFFYKKIRYIGRGYKIYKKRKFNKVKFRFGTSHKCICICKNFRFIKLSRFFYFIKFKNKNLISFFLKNFKIIKYCGKYTKRGLRIKRMRVKKRFGKISQAMSMLHRA